jgi:hypothetical protein
MVSWEKIATTAKLKKGRLKRVVDNSYIPEIFNMPLRVNSYFPVGR